MTSSHFNDYSLGGKTTTQAAAFPRMPKPENGGDFSTRYGGSSQFSSENKRPSAWQIFRTVRVRQAQRQHQEFPWIVCTKNREKHPVAFYRFSVIFPDLLFFFSSMVALNPQTDETQISTCKQKFFPTELGGEQNAKETSHTKKSRWRLGRYESALNRSVSCWQRSPSALRIGARWWELNSWIFELFIWTFSIEFCVVKMFYFEDESP